MKTIFRHKTFDLPPPKLIILLKGGLNNQIEQFNEKQFSSSVAKLLLDIGKLLLSIQIIHSEELFRTK